MSSIQTSAEVTLPHICHHLPLGGTAYAGHAYLASSTPSVTVHVGGMTLTCTSLVWLEQLEEATRDARARLAVLALDGIGGSYA